MRAIDPDILVTLSHNVFPVRGENRRWTTAVLNSFVQRGAARYLDTLSSELRAAGLAGALTFFAGLGGVISVSRARDYPLALLRAEPAVRSAPMRWRGAWASVMR